MIVTHPGKFGDILWALPTVRAIAASYGPVELQLSAAYGDRSFGALLEALPYIAQVVVREDWQIELGAPITPWHPPISDKEYAAKEGVIHLGYRDWPTPDLPRATYEQANRTLRRWEQHELLPLDLNTPWITVPPHETPSTSTVYAWTDEWFELKQGLVTLLGPRGHVLTRHGSRWSTEGIGPIFPCNWQQAARVLAGTKTVLADCSALHVLALALGKNVLLMEPNPHRHHPVFYPYGMDGPCVTVIRGSDGLPTFDARHVREALDAY